MLAASESLCRPHTVDETDRRGNGSAGLTITVRRLMDSRAFGDAPMGVALVGVTGEDCGRIVRANRALATLIGCTLEELTGSVVHEFIHTEDRARAAEEYAKMISQARSSCEGKGRLLAKEGGVRWVRVQAALMVTDGDSRPLVMLHINQIPELGNGPEATVQ
jgi:PAS domain S-box-containing protein